ncbi:MAG TPA: xanthine dehydrogenase family protein molybdopterin-binding subunit [Gemmatimonadaceae bacterium]|nr:xanthine dehydrogenase family protein molybdopterin-binding subunit [Gemmatimonadaceae bacterium]
MSSSLDVTRRDFVRLGAIAAGGLMLGFYLVERDRPRHLPNEGAFSPNGFLRIGTDGSIVVIIDKSEMGQGVVTSLAMLVAEELECSLDSVRTEFAPIHTQYNRLFAGARVTAFGRISEVGAQATGGSSSVQSSWMTLRRAGAAAREMLIDAAAARWSVARDGCVARNGAITHAATNRRASYAELADDAARLPIPADPPLKTTGFRLVGKRIPRLDTPSKVDGKAVFGLDVRLPGMLTAVIERCPVFGGKVRSFDGAPALSIPGVRRVVEVSSGVAVVADGTWPALRGRQALTVHWDEGSRSTNSSAAISRQLENASRHRGVVVKERGNPAAALGSAHRRIDATYEVPFLHTATMEPMNFTADVRADGCDLWGPTQHQSACHAIAAQITGLPPEKIAMHTTYLGGGFGRRFEIDFVIEAVELSKAVGAPVQVVWTREDDIRHGFYRPAALGKLRAALDERGRPVAWTHRIVSPSLLERLLPEFVENGVDPTSVEGASNIPYAVPNFLVDLVTVDSGVPVGSWRSTGNSQNIFITECFIDELAAAAGADPFEYRRALLGNSPRLKGVLELAAEKSGWGKALPRGHAQGIAAAHSFDSYVAQVAEVSVGEAGRPRVHRVTCVVDCGQIVNLDTVEAQMEGGIAFGLSAALGEAITIEKGRVAQGTFNDYRVLRMADMPYVDVYVVPSTESPGGVGEPGVPPIAPAVANALFKLTGRRIRSLPISRAPSLRT